MTFTLEKKIKPKLRGVSHLFGFVAALGACVFLMMAPAQGLQYFAGLLYGASLCLMFGCSSLYHRPTWSPQARDRLRRIDHASIFTLIAGTYTPLAVRATGGWSTSLTVMWGTALLGMIFVVIWTYAPRGLRAALYVVLGLLATPVLLKLHDVIGWPPALVLLVGSVVYIAGALVYARRWPNPRPEVFGYHEVFHVMVIVAAALHFGVVLNVQHG